MFNRENGVSYNTFDDWRIAPASRPLVNPPEVRTEYVDIPGADGSLDYTEVLNGVKYRNREGSWEFYVLNELFDRSIVFYSWNDIYSLMMRKIHGRRMRIELESDPGFYYLGRVFVDSWSSNKDYSKITIRYNLDPYKKPMFTSKDVDWKWSELFANQIYYGTFNVDDVRYRTFYNFTEHPLPIKYIFKTNMSVETDGEVVNYKPGEYDGVDLAPGDNKRIFRGKGKVIVDHPLGDRL